MNRYFWLAKVSIPSLTYKKSAISLSSKPPEKVMESIENMLKEQALRDRASLSKKEVKVLFLQFNAVPFSEN